MENENFVIIRFVTKMDRREIFRVMAIYENAESFYQSPKNYPEKLLNRLAKNWSTHLGPIEVTAEQMDIFEREISMKYASWEN